MLERLNAFKEKYRFASNSEAVFFIQKDATFRKEIVSLYKSIYNRSVSGCSNCICDAYVKLMLTKELPKMSEYKLRAGVILQDVGGDSRKMCGQQNITKLVEFEGKEIDLPLYHLITKPVCRQYFTALPTDIDELINEFKLKEPINIESVVTDSTEVKAVITEAKITRKPRGKKR